MEKHTYILNEIYEKIGFLKILCQEGFLTTFTVPTKKKVDARKCEDLKLIA